MKNFYIFILLISSPIHLKAQEIKLKSSLDKRSSYLITDDFTRLKFNALDSLAKAFEVKKVQTLRNQKYYICKYGNSFVKFTFLSFQTKFIKETKLIIDKKERLFQTNDSILLYGFTAFSNEGKKVSKNYSRYLFSAYFEETDSLYKKNEGNFIILPAKSKNEFWKRNFINLGYGMSYAAKNNPFFGDRKLAIAFGYAVETLHYIPIFGGAFFGSTKNDKIMIPVVSLSSLLIWKTVLFGLMIGKPSIKTYNKMINLKYRLPNSLQY